jgi:hypothetical protein
MFRSRKILSLFVEYHKASRLLSVVAELVIEHVSNSVAKGIMGSHRVCPNALSPLPHAVGCLGEIKTGGMDDPK